MREGQRQGLDSPQENLPRVQINSTGSVGGSGGPMRDDNNPSEDEVRALGLSGQSLLGLDLTRQAERAIHQSGIQIDNSAPISNPDIADVIRYLEQNPSQHTLETLETGSSLASTARGMAMVEENRISAAAENSRQWTVSRLMPIFEQVLQDEFVLSTGESDTETLTDISSGESKQNSGNSIVEGRTEQPTTSISAWHVRTTLHSSVSSLEAPESDESDTSNGDDISWRSMRHNIKNRTS